MSIALPSRYPFHSGMYRALFNLLPDMKVAKHKNGQWGWVSNKMGEIQGVFEYTKSSAQKP